MVRIDFSADFM